MWLRGHLHDSSWKVPAGDESRASANYPSKKTTYNNNTFFLDCKLITCVCNKQTKFDESQQRRVKGYIIYILRSIVLNPTRDSQRKSWILCPGLVVGKRSLDCNPGLRDNQRAGNAEVFNEMMKQKQKMYAPRGDWCESFIHVTLIPGI